MTAKASINPPIAPTGANKSLASPADAVIEEEEPVLGFPLDVPDVLAAAPVAVGDMSLVADGMALVETSA